MAEILQFFLTLGHVLAAMFFAMVPGSVIWLLAIGVYLLVRKATKGGWHQQASTGESTA